MKKCIQYLNCILLCIVLSLPVDARFDDYSLRQSILALEKTRNNIDSVMNKQSKLLSNKERHEYEIFLEYLDYQIFEYCQKIKHQFHLVKDLPCNFYKQNNQNGGDFSSEFKTTEQRIKTMDDMLASSLSEFDEMLLNEKRIIEKKSKEKHRNNFKSVINNENASELERYLQNNEIQETTDQQGATSSSANEREKKGDHQEDRNANTTTSGKVGKGVASTQSKNNNRIIYPDDDIVARQLREAAENETDPDLKEKLWEEYEKYKNRTKK